MGFLFYFCCWVVLVLYIFKYWPLIRYMICRYLLPFCSLPFHFLDGFLCCAESFFFFFFFFLLCRNVWFSPTCLFLLLLSHSPQPHLFLLYFIYLFKFLLWYSLFDLQCCTNFHCIATYTVSTICWIRFPHRSLLPFKKSSLCSTVIPY